MTIENHILAFRGEHFLMSPRSKNYRNNLRCPGCGKWYTNWKQLGGHLRWCGGYKDFKNWFENTRDEYLQQFGKWGWHRAAEVWMTEHEI